MMYEISREVFKQRLEEKGSFCFLNVGKQQQTYEGTQLCPFSSEFKNKVAQIVPQKTTNVVCFTLQPGDESAQQAAQEMKVLGYHFVYFYQGSAQDIVLDKGLN
jgi:hypothetical protein